MFIRLIGSSGWKAGTRNTSMLPSRPSSRYIFTNPIITTAAEERMGIAFLALVHIVDLATTAPSPTPATLLHGYNQTTTLALDGGGVVFFSSLRSKPDSGRPRPTVTERQTESILNPTSVGRTYGTAATRQTCRSILAGSGVSDYRNSWWKDDNRRPTYLLLMEAKLVFWPCVASARKMERYCLS